MEGEGTQLIEQIRELSSKVLTNLKDIDARLNQLYMDIDMDQPLDKEAVLEKILTLRSIIGACEKEDLQEIEDEKILARMLDKLNDLIEMTIGKEEVKK